MSKPHAIMIPYPYQGHITPFVYLAIKLASHGFTITFVNTHYIHSKISNSNKNKDDLFANARKSGLDIRYTTVNDGFPLQFDRSLNHDQFVEGLLHVFSAHFDVLVGDLVKCDPPVNCLIADTFYVWPAMIAEKYNLVYVSLWTEPALVFNLYYHMDLLKKNGHFASQDNRKDTIDYIPGVEAIEPRDLMSYLQATDIWTVVHRVIYKAFTDIKKADIIICNTVQELECDTLSALNKNQPTYAIGPIFPSGNLTKAPFSLSLWSESDCSQWLNSKPNSSVLYVSFGSYAHTSKEDLLEIAHGLQLSGVNFIWVLRPDIVSSDETDFLPVGFEESIKDRGLIVPWCKQIEVISHPATGGFLTHCGWNSTLESIWCGIPLICYPLLTDQFTNRKLVVNDWKIGINLCDKERVTHEEVAEKVSHFMCGNSTQVLRNAVKEVRKTLENALEKDGSSEKNFHKFMEDIKVNARKRAGLSNGHASPLYQNGNGLIH
ncbi:UDP-glycosyltransferase 86A1 [Capsicum annuum]|uniref:UDP-glycosyltransferase 86A1 n=1 Tax=Capsicum annuum TaxID=4072 RepID=UPI0007BF3A22|nr:UDP-glycosyltransferase 86A1 [Capsicum annuum]KAF3640737.1 UDP-glycosyltransferase 86A1 [Capsicum annuum]KAF3655933.1 UDP-glycosyltransferase 86A1 [Capsicum annuum]